MQAKWAKLDTAKNHPNMTEIPHFVLLIFQHIAKKTHEGLVDQHMNCTCNPI